MRAKLRQIDVAAGTGLLPANYGQYEYGLLPNPRLKTLRKFAEFYGITISQLLKDVE